MAEKKFGTSLIGHHPWVKKMEESSPILILTPADQKLVPIPDHFDGRKVWDDFLTPIFNQGKCGGCYAYSVVSVLQDKYTLRTHGQVRPNLNPIEVLMCHVHSLTPKQLSELSEDTLMLKKQDIKTRSITCDGGSLYDTARFIYRNGGIDDDCISFEKLNNYIQKHGVFPLCNKIEGRHHNFCEPSRVSPEGLRYAQRIWPAKNFYKVSNSNNLAVIANKIMWDIYKWGPLSVGFNIYEDFLNEYDGKSVYIPKPNQDIIGGHAVKIVGWGEEDKNGVHIPYWICANSWGAEWGEDGYFKIVRENPMLELEINNLSIVPQVPGHDSHCCTSDKHSEIRDMDRKLKENNDIDPWTLYPTDDIEAIKAGKMAGDIDKKIFTHTYSHDKEFWAYKEGSGNLQNSIISTFKNSLLLKKVLFILLLIIIVIGVPIVVYLIFRLTVNIKNSC